jgi:hypothetical protein
MVTPRFTSSVTRSLTSGAKWFLKGIARRLIGLISPIQGFKPIHVLISASPSSLLRSPSFLPQIRSAPADGGNATSLYATTLFWSMLLGGCALATATFSGGTDRSCDVLFLPQPDPGDSDNETAGEGQCDLAGSAPRPTAP